MRTEFDLINNIKSKYSLSRVGDDCAILPKNESSDTVVTADMLVEDIDLRLGWTSPEYLGHRSLAVSLSDIAAMGADPVASLVSVAVVESLWKTEFLDRFYSGWQQLAGEYGVELIGGDISATGGPLVIDSIVIGEVPKGQAILRSGANVGDSVFVSGSLGGAAGGLSLLEAGITCENADEAQSRSLRRQLTPTPQVILSNILRTQGLATAMIDISDGLSSDLEHICKASHTGARIYADMLPVDADLMACGFDHANALDMALHGGEDFELLFTSREKNISIPGPHRVTRIGEITEDIGNIELIRDGKPEKLSPLGYRHF